MPWAEGRRRRGSAILVVVALVLGSAVAATAAPEPDPSAPVAPVDTPGQDPVLDEVEVVSTSETRAAEDDFTAAESLRTLATLRALSAGDDRAAQAARLATAGDGVEAAQAALDAAQAVLDAESLELIARKDTQKAERAALAVQQEELRRLAVGVFISSPTDDFAWLAEADDLSAAERRDAVRERGVEQQSARVDAATAPWEDARAATEAQQEVVDGAQADVDARTEELATAVDERDHATELLAAADALVVERQADLVRAEDASHEAAVVRRKARLTAIVTGQDLRLVALDAYWRAAGSAPCRIPWWVLAGVGRVETRHGTAHGSELTAEGDTTVHILGIPLDGRPGVAAIGDTDGGALDGDGRFDRAVGPMQFIPSTWRRWAHDGNADGVADPHNIYDAAAAAAAYLCFGRGDLTTEAAIRGALLSYNASVPYGTIVLAEGNGYREDLDLPDRPEPDRRTTTGDDAGG